jgi:hypothetical protein
VLTLAPDLTPTGTPFMARLSQHLQYFVNKKISEDAEWRGVEIILSGHDVRAPPASSLIPGVSRGTDPFALLPSLSCASGARRG